MSAGQATTTSAHFDKEENDLGALITPLLSIGPQSKRPRGRNGNEKYGKCSQEEYMQFKLVY